MDSTTLDALAQLLDIINAGGVAGVMIIVIILFLKGDIIPRKVYEKLLRDLLSKITADIIAAVTQVLKEQQSYNEKQMEEFSRRFNHIEECIERSRYMDHMDRQDRS